MSFGTEYRKSLKAVEVEELLDLLFFRPLGFLLVKAVYRTAITPDQVTVLAILSGIAAGVCLGVGTIGGMVGAGVLLIVYDVLDCADGQLARVKGSGSRIGRILDGSADYIVTLSAYLGMGVGHASASPMPVLAWILVIAAGLSNAYHSVLLDFYRNRYLDNFLNRPAVLGDDLDEFRQEYARLAKSRERLGERGILWLYLTYSTLQRGLIGRRRDRRVSIPRDMYVRENRWLIRLWTFLGPTTELTLLILACFLNELVLYCWVILVIGNLLALILKQVQDRLDARLQLCPS